MVSRYDDVVVTATSTCKEGIQTIKLFYKHNSTWIENRLIPYENTPRPDTDG